VREAALLRRLKGVALVAPLLHAERDPDRLGAPFLILGFVEGVMLEDALSGADDGTTAALGRATGAALATVHAVTFDRAGFLDAGLRVAAPLDMGGAGLVAFAESQTALPLVAGCLGPARVAALHALLARQATALDAWEGPPCLAHSDANGSNIMVRQRARTGPSPRCSTGSSPSPARPSSTWATLPGSRQAIVRTGSRGSRLVIAEPADGCPWTGWRSPTWPT